MRKIKPTKTGNGAGGRRTRIALFADERHAVVRDFLRGFYGYIRPERDWLILQGRTDIGEMDAVLDWEPDYVIAPSMQKFFDLLDSQSIPVLYYLTSTDAGKRCWFRPDEVAVGEEAARHLVECGYRNAACVYDPKHAGSRMRMEGFTQAVSQSVESLITFKEPLSAQAARNAHQFTAEDPLMRDWLGSLPDSTAVYVWNDTSALWVTEVCFRLGIRVPEQIGVVGTDNHPDYCLRSWPALDSVMLPYPEIGRAVGQWIDQSVKGDRPLSPNPFSIPGIYRRKSTRQQSAPDPDSGMVLEALQKLPLEALSVATLLDALGWSRRTLDRRVRDRMRTTPNALIERRRLEEAEYLLANTDRTVDDITQACGFATSRSLELLFKKHHGTTPAAYGKMRR